MGGQQVFVGSDEVCRTKVIPMTLFPVWDETFLVFAPGKGGGVSSGQSGGGGGGDTLNPQGGRGDGGEAGMGGAAVEVPWGMRFEVWDYDAHGGNDYLGESRFEDVV